MKIIKLTLATIALFLTMQSNAQIVVNVNIGTPPAWGPAGYPSVRYYYIPDVEAYYDVEKTMFIYLYNGNWIYRSYLPSKYKHFDLYSGYKVVLSDYHGNKPYGQFKNHKVKYAKGYKGKAQKCNGNKAGKSNSPAKISPKNYKGGGGGHGNGGGNHGNGSGHGNGGGHGKGGKHH